MRIYKLAKGLKILVILVFGLLVFGFVVEQLWNWLIPGLFGGPALHFAQAVGLLVLARILVGRFGGGHGRRMGWRGRMRHDWQRMSPEERQKLRETMSRRCGG